MASIAPKSHAPVEFALVPYPVELIRDLAARHGLSGVIELMPDGGMVNEAWRVGSSAILRVVRPEMDPECDTEAAREAAVVRLVRSAGLPTPDLLAMGPAGEGHRPYTIYELVCGDLLGLVDEPVEVFEDVYAEMGAALAVLHRIEAPSEVRACLRGQEGSNACEQAQKAVDAGKLSRRDADEINAWAAHLAPAMAGQTRAVLVHNDVHPWNLIVRRGAISPPPQSPSPRTQPRGEGDVGLAAILDWGDASLGDPAVDFSGMPLQSIPAMLRGYATAGGVVDEHFVERSLIRGLSTALWEIRGLDASQFGRHWWRMPPGGWKEYKSLVSELFPGLAP